jgi:coenzyme F420-reducing hydrogenase gamma subunit
VYPTPEIVHALGKSTPIADHVEVDYELRGCPINKHQLVELLRARLAGARPNIPAYSVCVECKRHGTVCLQVAEGIPCLGPVTQAGCNALCPSYHRGCFGCYGPAETCNAASLGGHLARSGVPREDLVRLFRSYNACADEFRKESEVHER